MILAYGIHRWRPLTWPGKISMWVFVLLTLLFSVGMIGFFEGGYNHLVKNSLPGRGAKNYARAVFPPSGVRNA